MAKLTAKKRSKFLDVLAQGGSITRAASAICVSRNAMYALRDRDEVFRKAWDDAIEAGTDLLEDEALRRAKDGTDRPVFYKGDECGYVREYSDTLAIFLLKGRRPTKYGDKVKQEVTGEGGGPLAIAVKFVKSNGD